MSNNEIEALKRMIAEKELSIKRKEKKLELQKKSQAGSPLRDAELRLKAASANKDQAVAEASKAKEGAQTASGVPLAVKKIELRQEIEQAEEKHKEQEIRIAELDGLLREASKQHGVARAKKAEFLKSLMDMLSSLQVNLVDKMTRAVDQEEHGASDPYEGLQVIQELTKERELEISNNERQLREICQIISMKKEREQELKIESDKKIHEAKLKKDDEILQLVQQCQKERSDVMDQVDKLRQENEAQAACLHWKSHRTLRDIKDRKIDRRPTAHKTIREQITVPGVRRISKGGTAPKAAITSSPRPVKKKADAADGSPDDKRALREEEKAKIRRLESDIARVQSDFQKTKRQLEYKIGYERGQAAQFERENKKLEEQAEHLAQTLQRLKAEVKKQQHADPNRDLSMLPNTPRSINSPRPNSARLTMK